LDGEGNFLTLFFTVFLVGCRSPDGGIEGDIGGFAIRWTGLDVAAALALGLGPRTTPGLPASEPVDGGVDITGCKYFPGFCFFAALPPIGIARIEDILPGGFRRGLLLRLLVCNAWSYLTGFFFSSASESCGAGWVSSDSILAP
jgi:hypothetical protein